MLPIAPLGRIVNDLCFLPDKAFSIGCIFQISLILQVLQEKILNERYLDCLNGDS